MSEVRQRWERARARRRAAWWAVALVAASGHLAVLWVAGRLEWIPEPQFERPFVAFPEGGEGRAGAAWVEQGLLLDTAPLLLPTIWNGGVDLRSEVHVPALPLPFGSFGAEIAVTADALSAWAGVGGGPPAPEARLLWTGEPWDRWGIEPTPVRELPASSISVTIRSGLDGQEVATLAVPESYRADAGGDLWAPAEFLFFVAEGGRLGFPLLVTSSGVAAVDARLREFLAGASALGLLPPGYYRVTIGP